MHIYKKWTLAFCGGIVAVLIIQSGLRMNRPILVNRGKPVNEENAGKKFMGNLIGHECDKDADCPGKFTICNPDKQCQEMVQPVHCVCRHATLLQCTDIRKRVRNTECDGRCVEIADSAKCQE